MRTRPKLLLLTAWLNFCIFLSTSVSAAENEADAPADHTFKITDFGGKGDGRTLNTGAINKAIEASEDVEVRDVKITGGWDGIHFRGAPQKWCHRVKIIHCQFYTGDDSIAGRYWQDTLISGCILNSSCNGIRLIGPATHLIVDDCL